MSESILSQNLKLVVLAVTLITTGICSLTQSVYADTLIDGFTDATNDRFTNDTAFVVPSTVSLSGVGRANTNLGQWATLIGDNSFVTAAHRVPPVGSTIDFYPGNDPNAAPFRAIVLAGGSRVVTSDGSTDLYVGYLDRIVDSSIDRYEFARIGLSATPGEEGTVNIVSADSFQSQLGYILGISMTARDSSLLTIDQSVGLNRITGYAENVEFQSTTNNDTLIYEFDAVGDQDYVDNEAFVRGGDSGAPNFTIDANGDLLLLGVNSFQLNGEPTDILDQDGNVIGTEQFQATGITYTGNLSEEIDRLVAAAPDVSVMPVVRGDMNGDGVVDNFDITAFSLALFSRETYDLMYPEIDADEVGDFTDDGVMSNFDITGFAATLLQE